MSLTWVSRAHDEKGTFLLIFECFWSFLTMQTHAFAGRNTQQTMMTLLRSQEYLLYKGIYEWSLSYGFLFENCYCQKPVILAIDPWRTRVTRIMWIINSKSTYFCLLSRGHLLMGWASIPKGPFMNFINPNVP